jgi:hypothetical protein
MTLFPSQVPTFSQLRSEKPSLYLTRYPSVALNQVPSHTPSTALDVVNGFDLYAYVGNTSGEEFKYDVTYQRYLKYALYLLLFDNITVNMNNWLLDVATLHLESDNPVTFSELSIAVSTRNSLQQTNFMYNDAIDTGQNDVWRLRYRLPFDNCVITTNMAQFYHLTLNTSLVNGKFQLILRNLYYNTSEELTNRHQHLSVFGNILACPYNNLSLCVDDSVNSNQNIDLRNGACVCNCDFESLIWSNLFDAAGMYIFLFVSYIISFHTNNTYFMDFRILGLAHYCNSISVITDCMGI